MASSHFKKLDEESRALAERWDEIARVIAVVALVAVAVWALCAALRAAVHATGEVIVELSTDGWWGAAILLGALLAGSLIRTFLYRMPEWREAAGDGMQRAIENYQITYVYDGDDPEPRYRLPAFGAALRKAGATFVTLGSGASGGEARRAEGAPGEAVHDHADPAVEPATASLAPEAIPETQASNSLDTAPAPRVTDPPPERDA